MKNNIFKVSNKKSGALLPLYTIDCPATNILLYFTVLYCTTHSAHLTDWTVDRFYCTLYSSTVPPPVCALQYSRVQWSLYSDSSSPGAIDGLFCEVIL